ncbi:hypothetical protein M427DRAFT_257664 [Gonapodya prolifera JEL478]|uniref:Uncharacterized protein n=1 Tax=Gonapodya prolifera (strain JEL478) TaxID=1344416 RepID=A0A138ZX27_GONPJ|nr:hypothetical protein M427DRAFT_257664 [Gonapodya prolifera JEL478]|eukprot:KXS09072.1 hypothetical protein M427DRAFT_257664 [Gonapodya prolifera JEL478]
MSNPTSVALGASNHASGDANDTAVVVGRSGTIGEDVLGVPGGGSELYKNVLFRFATKSLAAPLGGQPQRTAPPAYTRSTGLDQKSYSAGQAGLWELEAPLTSVLRNTLAREQ